MIDFWIALPLALQLTLLGVLGLGLGAFANHVIYTLCWDRRPISPWVKPHKDAPPRVRTDLIPICGWWGLRREAKIHGDRFWVRPILIEIGMMIAVPALFYFETHSGWLLPAALRTQANLDRFEPWATHLFVPHVILFSLMVASTFIDFDERTIPDELTLPGTVFALMASCFSLKACLPAGIGGGLYPTTFELPSVWGPPWVGRTGFWTGLAIWSGWCFAIADRHWVTRFGFERAIAYFLHGITRRRGPVLIAGWFVGCVAIRIVFGIGGDAWHGLLSSLVGLGVGGGVVWAIRIVASGAMNTEAMGFGDVTLMAMIGAFLGWQVSVLGFFLAPMTAIVIVVIYWMVTGDNQVPFGPYLCCGTAVTVIFWDRLFNGWFLQNLAILGNFMLWLFIAMTGMMGVMLYVYRIVRDRFFFSEDEEYEEDENELEDS